MSVDLLFYPLSVNPFAFALLRFVVTVLIFHRALLHLRARERVRGRFLMAYAVLLYFSSLDTPSNPNAQVLTVYALMAYLAQGAYFGWHIWLDLRQRWRCARREDERWRSW